MSVALESPVTRFVLETILLHVQESLFIAGACQGKAFGNFVYDVIVPRMEDSTCNISFNSVSIWFRRKEQMRRYIYKMEQAISKLGLNCSFEEMTPPISLAIRQRYGLIGNLYNLYVHGSCIAWFDIVVSNEFPVNDFDIHCLTYFCREDNSTGKRLVSKQLQAEKGYSKEELIKAIHNKQATMFGSSAPYNYRKIMNRLIRGGWTINIGNVKFTKPVTRDELSLILNSDISEEWSCSSSNTGESVNDKSEIRPIRTLAASINIVLENIITDHSLLKDTTAAKES